MVPRRGRRWRVGLRDRGALTNLDTRDNHFIFFGNRQKLVAKALLSDQRRRVPEARRFLPISLSISDPYTNIGASPKGLFCYAFGIAPHG